MTHSTFLPRMLLVAAVACIPSSLGAGLPATNPDTTLAENDLPLLQGTWEIVSYETDGLRIVATGLGRVTFKGSHYTWAKGNGPSGSIVHIDSSKKPRTIDYRQDGAKASQTEHAIYEIKGNTFKDCIAPPGAERPKEFAVKRGSGYTLIIYKRVK